ncbi:phosphoribosyltransferase [Agrobacterium sp. ES01]|uniref:phosphoribosyltransferase n=1 Tax=Agrobacterium sp. ES01 TaxID=3420714 RepID=UPI003D0BE153
MQPQDVWQEVYPPNSFRVDQGHEQFFPATLGDGRQIRLPIRPLADGQHAFASLIINQASFSVVDALAGDLAERLSKHCPDIVIGLPTLGLTLASEVARKLGHLRYVPLGTSRKFWYDENLSVPLSSVTTPEQLKRLYIDPRMLPLIEGRRVALIDDVISSGRSIMAALALLDTLAIRPIVIGAAMLQSSRWREHKTDPYAGWEDRVEGCFSTPILEKDAYGLWQSPN